MSMQTLEQILCTCAHKHLDIVKIEYYCNDVIIWIQPMYLQVIIRVVSSLKWYTYYIYMYASYSVGGIEDLCCHSSSYLQLICLHKCHQKLWR